VSLAEDVAAALPVFRAQAESLMTDFCRVGTDLESATELDPATGQYVRVFVNVVYEGPCRFKSGNTAPGEVTAVGQFLVEQDAIVKFPVGDNPAIVSGRSADVEQNMVVLLTGSATDPDLVGLRARVKRKATAAGATSRRVPVEITS